MEKKLLEGDSKTLLRATDLISNWEDLIDLLEEEFASVENSATIHRKSTERKKRADESYFNYLL